MRELSASALREQLPRVLEDVERGESVAVTRDGVRVARIVPDRPRRAAEVDQAIATLRAFGRAHGKITVEEILSARDEGRRR